MDVKRLFKQYDLLITPSNYRRMFLATKNTYPSSKLRIMSLEQLSDALIYKVSDDARRILWNELKLDLESADIYLNNLGKTKSLIGESIQINKLRETEDFLKKANLITYDHNFTNLYKGANVAVYGYSKGNVELNNYLEKINAKVTYFGETVTKKTKVNVYKFASMREEIDYVFNKIIKLLSEGVTPNLIKIINLPEVYRPLISQAISEFSLPVNLNFKTPLINFPLVNNFFLSATNDNYEEQLNQLLLEYSEDISVIELHNLISVVPKDNLVNPLEYFKQLAKEKMLKAPEYEQGIEVINYFPFENKYHLFILGFSNNYFPIQKQDVDYLSDELKLLNGLNTSAVENEEAYTLLANNIFQAKNITLTLPNKANDQDVYVSPLVQAFRSNFNLINNPKSNVYYNKTNIEIKRASIRDLYVNYGELHEDYEYYLSFGNYTPASYSNTFNGLDLTFDSSYKKYSYTRINKFFECPYKYYLAHELNLDEFEETFYLKYGIIADEVLTKLYEEDTSFDERFTKAMAKVELSSKERLLLENLKEELEQAEIYIKRQDEFIKTHGETSIKMQQQFNFTLDNSNSHVSGIIDKWYTKVVNNKTTHYLIDYKTGNDDFDIKKVEYGDNLQLPLYALGVKKAILIEENDLIAGLFIQQVLTNKFKKDEKHDEVTYYTKALKLRGAALNDQQTMLDFDGSLRYGESQVVHTLSINKTNAKFNNYFIKRSYDLEKFDDLMKTTEALLNYADNKIRNHEFNIFPLKAKTDACKYCKFKNVCYISPGDEVRNDPINLKGEHHG